MRYPSWLTWYKKPEYRDIKEYSTAIVQGQRSLSPAGRSGSSIPHKLRLERILENKTCAPLSLHDFYMYLKYIEFSPENLEFYMWFKNYEADWKKNASEKDSDSFSSSSTTLARKNSKSSNVRSQSQDDLCSEDPEVAETLERISEIIGLQAMCAGDSCQPTFEMPKSPAVPYTLNRRAAAALSEADAAVLAPGRRNEVNAIVRAFLTAGAPKELNVPPAMRDQAIAALQHSLDPVHLQPVADHVYLLLRNCSHRNFVRLGVSNGTMETICMATSLGIVLTIAGVLLVLLRALYPHRGAHSRFEAFAAWPLWWLGISLVLSGLRGSCFFLLLFTRRQPLPWERFEETASMLSRRSGLLAFFSRLMIFDRKLRVKDDHLRHLQHRIVLQSLFFGAIFASFGVLIFIFLPVWS